MATPQPHLRKRWVSNLPDPASSLRLARELGISPVTAQVLVARGLADPTAARGFLAAGRDTLHDPFLLKDMDRAVALLRARLAANRPILVYGDYDVDGVTGTALLVSALRRAGAQVDYYIPHRMHEGYGLNAQALSALRDQGHDFVVCVDTGVTAVAEARHARALGLTLVITDHHEPGPELPQVGALINPKRPDCRYPFPGLAGAGVAFKLVQALLGDDPAWTYLDIVTLATVADLVPLVDENRALVREGLPLLAETRRPGLVALKEVAGLTGANVTPNHIGFALGPRINALGRMSDARAGVELLLTDSLERARELAARLDEENRTRQDTQETVLAQAMVDWQGQCAGSAAPPVAVLAGAGWHHGVLGICAAKVVGATWRPALLLSITGDEARGSARSIPGFPLHRALSACSDLLDQFGGHEMAAGLTLRAGRIAELRQRLGQLAGQWLRPEQRQPAVQVDAWLTTGQLTLNLARELAALSPFGLGNPDPVLGWSGAVLQEARAVGKNQNHLKLRLAGAGATPVDGIAFGLAGAPHLPAPGERVAVAFTPEVNEWQGRTRLQVRAVDLVPAAAVDVQPGSAALADWDPAAGCADAGRGDALDAGVVHWLGVTGTDSASRVLSLVSPGAHLLAVVQAPWAVAPLVDALRRRLDPNYDVAAWDDANAAGGAAEATGGDGPGPSDGGRARVRVTHWSALSLAAADCSLPPAGQPPVTLVAVQPPFHLGQVSGLPHLAVAWRESDWALGEVVLGWPYPDRPELVRIYRLLQQQTVFCRVEDLAAALAGSGIEPVGAWNRLRVEAALHVFAELGLVQQGPAGAVTLSSQPSGERGKMNLDSSSRFRRGEALRAAYRQAQDWFATAGRGNV